ncbi:MAG TPA: ScpA family protein [Candidatus Paceibacterota bacterium]|nr:ScpA family protein [Candidatus Paceibacterota bacterium]
METETSWQIKQEGFEGPIEVLLELIEKRKVFVGDISLAAVTDDFISYIQTHGMVPDQVAHFLAVAATLILIKARSLLPTLPLTEEETESITDLERRLALYQLTSHAARALVRSYGKKISFEGTPQPHTPVFAPDPHLTIIQLPELITTALARIPPPQGKAPEARVTMTISITEVIETLQSRIEHMLSCNFSDIQMQAPTVDEKEQKIYTIVSFLGMLELVRKGFVAAEQHDPFAAIHLERRSPLPL